MDTSWEAVFETIDGNLFSLPFDTIRVPQAGSVRMRSNDDGELHPTHRVQVNEGDKITYHSPDFVPPVEGGYLDGVWPALPSGDQKYIIIYLLTPGYKIIYIAGNNLTPVTYQA